MTEHLTVDDLQALPVGSVIVDPFDAKGDSPVVACKNSGGFWDILGERDPDRVWWSGSLVESSVSGLLRVVYVPAETPGAPAGTSESVVSVADEAGAVFDAALARQEAKPLNGRATPQQVGYFEAGFEAGAKWQVSRKGEVTDDMVRVGVIAGLDAVQPTWRATGSDLSPDDLAFTRAALAAAMGGGTND